jgi:hypothetical protein
MVPGSTPPENLEPYVVEINKKGAMLVLYIPGLAYAKVGSETCIVPTDTCFHRGMLLFSILYTLDINELIKNKKSLEREQHCRFNSKWFSLF